MDEHRIWANGSVWHKDWPHKVYADQWSIFYGPVILPYLDCQLQFFYPGQNFWGSPLALSVIFRGPFGIFEGHGLMEEYNGKKESYNKSLFWTLQGLKITLKSKTWWKNKWNFHLLARQDKNHCSRRNRSTSMTKTFWKQCQNVLKRLPAILKSRNRLLKCQCQKWIVPQQINGKTWFIF